MHNPEIWTNAAREHLYERVLLLFGPLQEWEKSSSPGRGLDDAFDAFCASFAEVCGAKTKRAVKLQIRFAVSANGRWWANGHTSTAILNKAAALRAGFISRSELPELTAKSR